MIDVRETAARTSLRGQTLLGRYEVEALLAREGISLVHAAHDRRLDGPACVKVFHSLDEREVYGVPLVVGLGAQVGERSREVGDVTAITRPTPNIMSPLPMTEPSIAETSTPKPVPVATPTPALRRHPRTITSASFRSAAGRSTTTQRRVTHVRGDAVLEEPYAQ